MPRRARHAPGDMIFHVLNRGNARDELFSKEDDYAAFEKVLLETQELVFVRILGYCLMPNHWHLVLWPLHEGDLGRFMQRLTTTHVRRWQLHHQSVGTGHLYQGTDKSFPIEADDHLDTVLRDVERNPVRPTLVLCPWPIPRPSDWLARVNRALTKKEREAVLGKRGHSTYK
jgi:putative transposase